MGAPYTSVAISGYSSNPPSDDGQQTEANRGKYSTIKTKLGDPVKTLAETMNTNILAAVLKMIGGNGITSTAISYQVLSTDQGKLIYSTGSGLTHTTPDATDVDDPFVFGVKNAHASSTLTVDGFGAQTINGAASVTIQAGDGCLFFTDGTNWFTTGLFPAASLTLSAALVADTITGNTSVTTAALSASTVAGAAVATQAQQETGSATDRIVSPGRQHFHQSAAKGWVQIDANAGNVTSYNVSSIGDNGAGTFTVNWGTDFFSTAYNVQATPVLTSVGSDASTYTSQISNSLAAGTTQVVTVNHLNFASTDPNFTMVTAFGDHA